MSNGSIQWDRVESSRVKPSRGGKMYPKERGTEGLGLEKDGTMQASKQQRKQATRAGRMQESKQARRWEAIVAEQGLWLEVDGGNGAMKPQNSPSQL